MQFSSITFIFLFLPITVAIYYFVPQRFKNPVMLAASVFFYAWGEPEYVLLLVLSTVFNYFCARDVEEKQGEPWLARRSLLSAVVVNLLILGYFKYYGWLLSTFNELFSVSIPYRELSLPIGLSFYTLRAIGYLVDVYRKEVKAQKNVFHFALYMMVFPKLNAGPLTPYAVFEPQLGRRTVNVYTLGRGASKFICGLAKKVILADRMGEVFAQVFAFQMETFSILTAWVGCVAFAFQIYFDFSGYSDMAQGLGMMFGFELGINFRYPYTAKSVSEFWRKWHISLGNWFRKYVYVPLGGNQGGVGMHARNILVVWLLTGLWHGGKWNLVLWGFYFAVILILEKYAWGNRLAGFPDFVQHAYTFIAVSVGWVLFFAPNTGYAMDYLEIMFGFGRRSLVDQQSLYLIITHWLLFVICVLCASMRGWDLFRTMTESYRNVVVRRLAVSVFYLLLLIVCIAFVVTEECTPFVY